MHRHIARRFALGALLTVLATGCQHSFTKEDAAAAIGRHEALHRLLQPDTELVARETVTDCRALYTGDTVTTVAGDSAWILLSSAGWMDLADVDAPSDPRQKKHCRAVLTSKADKTAFKDGQNASTTPWTSYWVVETAHKKVEVLDIPDDSRTRSSAIADFQLAQDPTKVGGILHRPRWSEEEARLYTATLTGRFRYADGAWQLEGFDEKK